MLRTTTLDGKPALYNTETGECALLPASGRLLKTAADEIVGAMDPSTGQVVHLIWIPLYAHLGVTQGRN